MYISYALMPCRRECRVVFAFLNVLENDLLKISLARHRGKTTSKLIKNLLPSLKNVTPVACRSIPATLLAPALLPTGRGRTFHEDENAKMALAARWQMRLGRRY